MGRKRLRLMEGSDPKVKSPIRRLRKAEVQTERAGRRESSQVQAGMGQENRDGCHRGQREFIVILRVGCRRARLGRQTIDGCFSAVQTLTWRRWQSLRSDGRRQKRAVHRNTAAAVGTPRERSALPDSFFS
ncbi:unnamed protein product [Heligmosomoides polygyrus]|uniref:Uncharacterized protein n=1 Tax=Heligmosomoides polygyrus TaxID=6339 RepID=A0A183F7A8_HELPZ|nr:unnamed protein product [Heligmosomoides polygyrus]